MKKFTLSILFFATCALSLSAQVTQSQADSIALHRMSSDTRAYTLYANAILQQEGYTITTSLGEVFELDYPCWVYYVHYTEETTHKYLVVKNNTGNLLEMNVRNDEGPEDLNWWWILFPTPPPCHCIMDTLRGKWRWVQTTGQVQGGSIDNAFGSVIKIFSQNTDGSINYEVFAEDTLYYRGTFQILLDNQYCYQGYPYNIILPYDHPFINIEYYHWYFDFVNIPLPWIPTNEIGWRINNKQLVDSYYYYYQKIR